MRIIGESVNFMEHLFVKERVETAISVTIVGSDNSIANEYEIVKDEKGFLVSRKVK